MPDRFALSGRVPAEHSMGRKNHSVFAVRRTALCSFVAKASWFYKTTKPRKNPGLCDVKLE